MDFGVVVCDGEEEVIKVGWHCPLIQKMMGDVHRLINKELTMYKTYFPHFALTISRRFASTAFLF